MVVCFPKKFDNVPKCIQDLKGDALHRDDRNFFNKSAMRNHSSVWDNCCLHGANILFISAHLQKTHDDFWRRKSGQDM